MAEAKKQTPAMHEDEQQEQQVAGSFDVAGDGHIESMRGPLANLFNSVSVSPDGFFPFCK